MVASSAAAPGFSGAGRTMPCLRKFSFLRTAKGSVVSASNFAAPLASRTLISVLRHGLTEAGRFLAIRLLIPDRPGELRNVLDLIAEGRGNVVSVDHHREGRTTSALQTELEIIVSTRDEAHCQELLASIREAGYTVERVGPPA